MKAYENGKIRDMTAAEISEMEARQSDKAGTSEPDALTKMITAMSTATSLSQMRSAAKEFLDKTEG